jgi:predicted CoA-binding protein
MTLIEAIASHIHATAFVADADAAAQAALTAMAEAGYAVVPVEPTEAMVEAGNNALCDNGVDDIQDDDALAAYRAMISAAQGDG